MSKAVIFGKFCPLHNGHLTLIRATLKLHPDLLFGLFVAPNDPISAEIRMGWLSRFGDVELINGGYEDIDIRRFGGIDLVAGSNSAVPEVARRLKAEHFMWDPEREALAIESEKILADPFKAWLDLPDFVRLHAQKRLTFVGPESVGKSFFAKRMADQFGGPHVPEYGRPHETFRPKSEYSGQELAELALRHRASRYALSQLAGPVLFEDTDELMTAVWSEMLLGQTTEEVEALVTLPDLYILYGADTPWEEDKIRYYAKQEMRIAFFERIEAKLKAHHAPYVVIDGTWQEREKETIGIILSWLSTPAVFR